MIHHLERASLAFSWAARLSSACFFLRSTRHRSTRAPTDDTDFFLRGVGTSCPYRLLFKRLPQFSDALPLEDFALSLPAKPGLVTVSFRHSSLRRPPRFG
jgi:hypothetical protein